MLWEDFCFTFYPLFLQEEGLKGKMSQNESITLGLGFRRRYSSKFINCTKYRRLDISLKGTDLVDEDNIEELEQASEDSETSSEPHIESNSNLHQDSQVRAHTEAPISDSKFFPTSEESIASGMNT